MKLRWLKPLLLATGVTLCLAALLQISPVDEVHAAPGGQGMGMGGGPVCPPACPPSAVNCDANLVISETLALSFGSFSVPVGGGGGTVVVDPNGLRTTPTPAGIVLITGGGESAATFSMTTTPYNCTGRALVMVTAFSASGLTGPGPAMALDTFVLIPAAGDAFDSAVPLQVGATLHVADGQTAGNYSGTYTVTITFQ